MKGQMLAQLNRALSALILHVTFCMFHTCNPFPCLEPFRYLPEFRLGYCQGLMFALNHGGLPCHALKADAGLKL